MKHSLKLLSLTLALTLSIGAPAGIALSVSAQNAPNAQNEQNAPMSRYSGDIAAAAESAGQVYLVPGEGNTLEGTPLTAEEASALHMEEGEKVYAAGAAGSVLPTPATTKTDSLGAGYVFNGWWTIMNAEVTYCETVPAVEETTFLYADFRAPLSQKRDPVAPSGGTGGSTPENYMRVTRAATGEVELIPLYVSGTEVSNAEHAGHSGPVQWYNEWFVMEPGDTVSYWFSHLYGAQPMYGPRPRHTPTSCDILLNSSGEYGKTGMYMEYVNDDYDANEKNHSGPGHTSHQFYNANAADEPPTLSYTGELATQPYIFRIYIQFYDQGGHMTLFMDNLSLKLGVEA